MPDRCCCAQSTHTHPSIYTSPATHTRVCLGNGCPRAPPREPPQPVPRQSLDSSRLPLVTSQRPRTGNKKQARPTVEVPAPRACLQIPNQHHLQAKGLHTPKGPEGRRSKMPRPVALDRRARTRTKGSAVGLFFPPRPRSRTAGLNFPPQLQSRPPVLWKEKARLGMPRLLFIIPSLSASLTNSFLLTLNQTFLPNDPLPRGRRSGSNFSKGRLFTVLSIPSRLACSSLSPPSPLGPPMYTVWVTTMGAGGGEGRAPLLVV